MTLVPEERHRRADGSTGGEEEEEEEGAQEQQDDGEDAIEVEVGVRGEESSPQSSSSVGAAEIDDQVMDELLEENFTIFEEAEDELNHHKCRVTGLAACVVQLRKDNERLHTCGVGLQNAYEKLDVELRESVGDAAYWQLLAEDRGSVIAKLEATLQDRDADVAELKVMLEASAQANASSRRQHALASEASKSPEAMSPARSSDIRAIFEIAVSPFGSPQPQERVQQDSQVSTPPRQKNTAVCSPAPARSSTSKAISEMFAKGSCEDVARWQELAEQRNEKIDARQGSTPGRTPSRTPFASLTNVLGSEMLHNPAAALKGSETDTCAKLSTPPRSTKSRSDTPTPRGSEAGSDGISSRPATPVLMHAHPQPIERRLFASTPQGENAHGASPAHFFGRSSRQARCLNFGPPRRDGDRVPQVGKERSTIGAIPSTGFVARTVAGFTDLTSSSTGSASLSVRRSIASSAPSADTQRSVTPFPRACSSSLNHSVVFSGASGARGGLAPDRRVSMGLPTRTFDDKGASAVGLRGRGIGDKRVSIGLPQRHCQSKSSQPEAARTSVVAAAQARTPSPVKSPRRSITAPPQRCASKSDENSWGDVPQQRVTDLVGMFENKPKDDALRPARLQRPSSADRSCRR